MKTIILFFSMIFTTALYSQTMRVTYFRTKEVNTGINLYWKTFVEDGSDTFKIYKSINSAECDYSEDNWELITKIPNNNIKDGEYYNMTIPKITGKQYYRLVWGQYNYKLYSYTNLKETNEIPLVYCYNNIIHIPNSERIYNLYNLVNQTIIANIQDGQSIENLPVGIYIITDDVDSYKIIKR